MDLDRWRQTGQTFRYRGHRVFYRREGVGETLLLIHGFPTASWDWHRIWDGLTQRFEVVAADMLGFGFSDKPPGHEYSLMDQATLHERLLEHLGIGRLHLVAHDYGDTVAQELLARRAERGPGQGDGIEIRSACLLNGGIIPGTQRPLVIQRLLMSPLGAPLGRLLSIRTLRRSFARIFGPETQPTERELVEFWSLIEQNGGRRVIHRLIRYMQERERYAARWIEILSHTDVPLRLIVGLVDPISGSHVADAYRALVRDADVVELPRIGHYPQLEAPDEVRAAIVAHAG